jgi:hypothetical protein
MGSGTAPTTAPLAADDGKQLEKSNDKIQSALSKARVCLLLPHP